MTKTDSNNHLDFWAETRESFKNSPLFFVSRFLNELNDKKIGLKTYEGILRFLKISENEEWFNDRHAQALIALQSEFEFKNQFDVKNFKFPSLDTKIEVLSGLKASAFDWENQKEVTGIIQKAIFDLKEKGIDTLLVNINGVDAKLSVHDFEVLWATQRSGKVGFYRALLPFSSTMFYIVTDY